MNYSLTSNKKLNKYNQQIVTSVINANTAETVALQNQMFLWHTVLSVLDPEGVDSSINRNKISFTEMQSEDLSTPLNAKCDISVNVLINKVGYPRMITFRLTDIERSNLASAINEKVGELLGTDIIYVENPLKKAQYYIVSAVMNLHA